MSEILVAILLSGIMGLFGQGIRAVIGLKRMGRLDNTNNIDEKNEFSASYLWLSLMIGFLSGIAAAFTIGFDKMIGVSKSDVTVLLGIAAAGYAGADVIENALSIFIPSKNIASVARSGNI